MSKYSRKKEEQVVEKVQVSMECLKDFLPIMESEQEGLGKHIHSVLDITNFHQMIDPYKKLLNRFDDVEDFLEAPFNLEGQISAFNFYKKHDPEQCLVELKKTAKKIEQINVNTSSIGAKLLRINPKDENIKDYKKAISYRLHFMNNTIDYYYHYGFYMGLKWCFGLCNDFELLNIELNNDEN